MYVPIEKNPFLIFSLSGKLKLVTGGMTPAADNHVIRTRVGKYPSAFLYLTANPLCPVSSHFTGTIPEIFTPFMFISPDCRMKTAYCLCQTENNQRHTI